MIVLNSAAAECPEGVNPDSWSRYSYAAPGFTYRVVALEPDLFGVHLEGDPYYVVFLVSSAELPYFLFRNGPPPPVALKAAPRPGPSQDEIAAFLKELDL